MSPARLDRAAARQEILEEELELLRELPYALWKDLVGSTRGKAAVGRDGRTYRLRIRAQWAESGSSDVLVTVTVWPRGWAGWRSTGDRFLVTPTSSGDPPSSR